MHEPEPNPENQMHIIIWDFEIPTDQQIQARRADLVIFDENKNLPNSTLPSQQRKKYLNLAREQRNLWNMRVMVIPVVIGMSGTVHKIFERGQDELEI